MPLERDLKPGEPWVFDRDVAAGFDDMLERSIPAYAQMRTLVTELADRFAPPNGLVVDLGCSSGGAIDALSRRRPALRILGLEVSEPMVELARERFADRSRVKIARHDLREPIPGVELGGVDVVLSVLTLMFVPVEHRPRVLRDVGSMLRAGGAFLLVEKTRSSLFEAHEAFVASYHSMKVDAGYSIDEVERKRLALEGVLVPDYPEAIEHQLRAAGLWPERFWTCLNFAGWVAVKR